MLNGTYVAPPDTDVLLCPREFDPQETSSGFFTLGVNLADTTAIQFLKNTTTVTQMKRYSIVLQSPGARPMTRTTDPKASLITIGVPTAICVPTTVADIEFFYDLLEILATLRVFPESVSVQGGMANLDFGAPWAEPLSGELLERIRSGIAQLYMHHNSQTSRQSIPTTRIPAPGRRLEEFKLSFSDKEGGYLTTQINGYTLGRFECMDSWKLVVMNAIVQYVHEPPLTYTRAVHEIRAIALFMDIIDRLTKLCEKSAISSARMSSETARDLLIDMIKIGSAATYSNYGIGMWMNPYRHIADQTIEAAVLHDTSELLRISHKYKTMLSGSAPDVEEDNVTKYSNGTTSSISDLGHEKARAVKDGEKAAPPALLEQGKRLAANIYEGTELAIIDQGGELAIDIVVEMLKDEDGTLHPLLEAALTTPNGRAAVQLLGSVVIQGAVVNAPALLGAVTEDSISDKAITGIDYAMSKSIQVSSYKLMKPAAAKLRPKILNLLRLGEKMADVRSRALPAGQSSTDFKAPVQETDRAKT